MQEKRKKQIRVTVDVETYAFLKAKSNQTGETISAVAGKLLREKTADYRILQSLLSLANSLLDRQKKIEKTLQTILQKQLFTQYITQISASNVSTEKLQELSERSIKKSQEIVNEIFNS